MGSKPPTLKELFGDIFSSTAFKKIDGQMRIIGKHSELEMVGSKIDGMVFGGSHNHNRLIIWLLFESHNQEAGRMKRKMTLKQYEGSAADKRADKAAKERANMSAAQKEAYKEAARKRAKASRDKKKGK